MKFLTKILAALALVACAATAFAQQVPASSVGPMNASSVLCNSQAAVAFGFDCPLGAGLQVNAATGALSATGTGTDTGTTFTLSAGTGSCASTATLVGGATRGSFVCTGTAGAGTVLVTMGTGTAAAAHGWACSVQDSTAPSAGETKAPANTAAATLAFTTAVNTDVIVFACFAY